MVRAMAALSLSLTWLQGATECNQSIYVCVCAWTEQYCNSIVQYCMYAMEKGKGLDNGPGRTDWAGLHTAWDSTA